jgi:hypothetical protein
MLPCRRPDRKRVAIVRPIPGSAASNAVCRRPRREISGSANGRVRRSGRPQRDDRTEPANFTTAGLSSPMRQLCQAAHLDRSRQVSSASSSKSAPATPSVSACPQSPVLPTRLFGVRRNQPGLPAGQPGRQNFILAPIVSLREELVVGTSVNRVEFPPLPKALQDGELAAATEMWKGRNLT